MDYSEFVKYILSIGFKYNDDFNEFNYNTFNINYTIEIGDNKYLFAKGDDWFLYNYNDLRTLRKEFTNELRSIKLKKLLYL